MAAAAAILDRYQGLVRELLSAIGAEVAGGVPEKDPTELIAQIVAEDKLLKEEVRKYKKRQELHREMERLTSSIDASDAVVVQVERRLRLIESSLIEALGEAKEKLANIKKAEAAEATVEELLGLGHRLSAAHSTTAPRDWQPGTSARRPFPSVHEMKSGSLAALAADSAAPT
eukprot:m.41879 g.41879  ORF g.41879 m.41879 type:complete len:173 (+) comp8263_c0_seq1:4299-4817(+)